MTEPHLRIWSDPSGDSAKTIGFVLGCERSVYERIYGFASAIWIVRGGELLDGLALRAYVA